MTVENKRYRKRNEGGGTGSHAPRQPRYLGDTAGIGNNFCRRVGGFDSLACRYSFSRFSFAGFLAIDFIRTELQGG